MIKEYVIIFPLPAMWPVLSWAAVLTLVLVELCSEVRLSYLHLVVLIIVNYLNVEPIGLNIIYTYQYWMYGLW